MRNLHLKIKKLREQAGLSQTELAKQSDLSLAYIAKLEQGRYKTLTLNSSRSLADGLGLSLPDFLAKIGFIRDEKRPSMKLITQAFRGSGYSADEAEKIIEYARFIKKRSSGGA